MCCPWVLMYAQTTHCASLFCGWKPYETHRIEAQGPHAPGQASAGAAPYAVLWREDCGWGRGMTRRNDGHRSSVERVLPIDARLMAKLLAEFAEVRPRAEPKTYHGPRAARGSPASSITDEQVLAMRKMREWAGMSPAQIARETALPISTVIGIVEWRNRVHLDPGPRPIE